MINEYICSFRKLKSPKNPTKSSSVKESTSVKKVRNEAEIISGYFYRFLFGILTT